MCSAWARLIALRVLHTPSVAFAPTEQTTKRRTTYNKQGVGGRVSWEYKYKHEEQMKMSCSQLATPLTPVQDRQDKWQCSSAGSCSCLCYALVVAFCRGTRAGGRERPCTGKPVGYRRAAKKGATRYYPRQARAREGTNDLRSVLMLRKIEQGALTN